MKQAVLKAMNVYLTIVSSLIFIGSSVSSVMFAFSLSFIAVPLLLATFAMMLYAIWRKRDGD